MAAATSHSAAFGSVQSELLLFVSGVLRAYSDNSIFACNLDGLIVIWSDGARGAYGYEADEVVGEATWEQLGAPEDAAAGQARELLAAALRDGGSEGIVGQARKNGQRFLARVFVTLCHDSAGQPNGFVLVARDAAADRSAVGAELKSRGILESGPDARLIARADGQILQVNAQLEKLLGYDRQVIIGQPATSLFRAREGEFLAGRGDEPDFLALNAIPDLVIRRCDGSELPVEVFFSAARSLDGIFFVGNVRDVSARNRLEKLLHESEERFRNTFENTNVAMALVDLDDLIARVNSAFSKLLGYTAQEMIGMGYREIMHPDDWAESSARRQALFMGHDEFFQIEKRYRHKDGAILWGLTNVSLVRDGGGRPLQFVEQVQDISEQKQLETKFFQARKRLQHVVASNPAVLCTWPVDGEMHPTWLSENVQEMLGYTVEEALQPNWWAERVHPDDLARVLVGIRDLFELDRVADEYRIRDRDGKYHWVRSEMRLLRDSSARPTEIVGSWSDITERKHLEDQFRQSQKMEAIGRLAGGVAHDFNNLLTVITGYSEILIDNFRPGDPLRGFTDQIRKAGERAAALTRQLLAFSRKQVLLASVLDLNSLLREMETMLSRLIGEDVEFTFIPDPALWRVKVDLSQMEQVVMNLVVNARDAMPRGGKLQIETANVELDATYASHQLETRPGQYIRLSISDSGCGMDEKVRARIFEPFFTTKGPEKGTGLGLATVYGIVKQSGGGIEVWSEPGAGTTFKIYLPRAGEELSKSKIFGSLAAPRRGVETILLVEDEDGVRALARVILEKHGYHVLEARNGGEAIFTCQRHAGPIHLMVTDVVMPNMGGRELAEHLASVRPDMKVLYLSGYTDEAVVEHGVIDASMHFLQKPFTSTALTQKVRSVLDGSETIGFDDMP